MTSDDIDRVLSRDDTIVPSSGFAASVMQAVHRDSEMPPPIPFPWKRALPGLIYCVMAAAVLLSLTLSTAAGSAEVTDPMARFIQVAEVTKEAGLGWILLALAVSLVSVVLSMSLGGTRATGE